MKLPFAKAAAPWRHAPSLHRRPTLIMTLEDLYLAGFAEQPSLLLIAASAVAQVPSAAIFAIANTWVSIGAADVPLSFFFERTR